MTKTRDELAAEWAMYIVRLAERTVTAEKMRSEHLTTAEHIQTVAMIMALDLLNLAKEPFYG